MMTTKVRRCNAVRGDGRQCLCYVRTDANNADSVLCPGHWRRLAQGQTIELCEGSSPLIINGAVPETVLRAAGMLDGEATP